MKFYEWNNKGFIECDVFAELSREEFKIIEGNLNPRELQHCSMDDEHYFAFVNTKHKIIAPLKTLAYAFGGMYDELPIGVELANVKIDISEYQLEDEKFLVKLAENSNKLINNIGNE